MNTLKYTVPGQITGNSHISAAFDSHLKPREERDFKEIYPDLEENYQLKVFVVPYEEDVDHEDMMDITTSLNSASELKKPVFRKISNHMGDTSHVKFNKSITEFGFQEPNRVRNKSISDSYIRPFQLPQSVGTNDTSVDTIEKLIDRKKNLVEYDMDEQDFFYLKHRNEIPSNIIKITPEVFEIMITTLENEWDKLEHQINSMINNSGDIDRFNEDPNNMLSLDRDDIEKYGTDDGIIPGSIYDQKCAVCDDSDCDNSNAIVFCDGCDIAVHQECYGIAFIPEGQWLCRKCMINKNMKTGCVFCPSKSGAFKQLDNSLWSHVICALWINELYFANPIYMEPIEGMDLIPKSRWKLTCYICKQRVGACIQCINRSCFSAYHVTCAKRAGLYMEMTKGIEGAISNKMTLQTYCDKHSPSHWNNEEVIRGIQRVRMFYRDTKLLNERNATLSNYKKKANKLNIFKWKTETNTPIAPQLFSDVLFEILLRLKVENQISLPHQNSSIISELNVLPNRSKEEIWTDLRNITNEICRYWCLKREQKKGAPLIRKNNNLLATSSILYNTASEEGGIVSNSSEHFDDITQRIDFANILVKDLDRVISLSSETLSRQNLSSDIHELDLNMVDTVYFPVKRLIENCLEVLNSKYDSGKVIQSYKLKHAESKRKLQSTSSLSPTSGSEEGDNSSGERSPLNSSESESDTPVLTLHQIIQKNARYEYASIKEFQYEVERFHKVVIEQNKPSNNVYKLMKKWLKEFYKILPEMRSAENKITLPYSENVEAKRNLHFPSIDVEGSVIGFRRFNANEVLKAYGLSDVEEDMDENNEKLLAIFLKGYK